MQLPLELRAPCNQKTDDLPNKLIVAGYLFRLKFNQFFNVPKQAVIINKIIVGLMLVLSFSTWGTDSKNNHCQDIKIINGSIMTTITVEGIRGNLSIPAIIDTGAYMSVIPQSIAEGIGYKYKYTKEFSTVGAKRKFKVVTVKKISMLGMDFNNIEVVIEPKNSGNERALIGMSELAKTSFSVKGDIFTICGKKGTNVVSDVNDDFKSTNSYADVILVYQGLCELDDGKGCFNLGVGYDKGQGVRQDYFKAVEYFKKACELDYGKGCFNLGVGYGKGQGVRQDYFKAVEYFKKACELDVGEGCFNLGLMYHKGVKQDYFKAVEYYKKACELDYGKGCFNLGFMYNNGQGVKQDYFKAVEYYKKACGLDDGGGCSNLGIMYYNGQGVRQDYFKAVEYFKKACELDNGEGCSSLGFMYGKGQGVRQSKQKALEYFSKACDLKDSSGCENYAKLRKN